MAKKNKTSYDCTNCVAYCCSVYERVEVNKRDIKRLAKHFDVTQEQAVRRFTRIVDGDRVLRRKKDTIFEHTCMFLDQETRLCGIYDARPEICRDWPGKEVRHCVYYDLLEYERRQQGPEYVPVVEIRVLE